MKASAVMRQAWGRMALREQRLVVVATVLVLAGLAWSLALAPALRVLREAPAKIVTLDAQLQTMQSLAAQARGMQKRPAVSREETLRALESSLRQSLGAGAQLRISGDRATVVLKGVSPDLLAQWLGQARVGARAIVSQADLVRGTNGWEGTLVLDLPPAA